MKQTDILQESLASLKAARERDVATIDHLRTENEAAERLVVEFGFVIETRYNGDKFLTCKKCRGHSSIGDLHYLSVDHRYPDCEIARLLSADTAGQEREGWICPDCKHENGTEYWVCENCHFQIDEPTHKKYLKST